MKKVREFDRISNQFLLKSNSLCKSMEPFFFSMFLCICRVFLKYSMRVTLSKIILSILMQNLSKTLFSLNRYKLMMDCWKDDPNERPSFSQLILILEEMMTVDTPYYDFTLLDESQACYSVASAPTTSKTVTPETRL